MYREHLTLSLDGIRQLLSHLHGEITRLEADAAQMLLASKLDELTGLLRRGEFFKILEHKLVECRAEHIEVGIMMIDIDRFKSINDQLGHLTGDEVIKGVAKLLLTLDGPIVAAGRFGGEEFVVLVQGSMDQMAELAETIRNSTQALRGPIIGPDGALNLKEFWNCTLSVGCSSSRTQGYDANRLVAAADQALFGAKRSGRNQVRAA